MSDLVYFKKSKLDALADKINEKCGGVEPLFLDEMIDKCLTAVENEECRKYLENRTDYRFCFGGGTGEKIPYFIMNKNAKSSGLMFAYSDIVEMTNLDFSNIEDGDRTFSDCRSFKKISINTSKMKNVSGLFNGCRKLVDAGILDFGNVLIDEIERTNSCFRNCVALVKVRFVAQSIKRSLSFVDSPLLSAESVQSIIDGLATVTTAQTITFHKNIALSDEQKQTINEKGWTLVQA